MVDVDWLNRRMQEKYPIQTFTCRLPEGLLEFVMSQHDLPPEAEKVLNDNLWHLYE